VATTKTAKKRAPRRKKKDAEVRPAEPVQEATMCFRVVPGDMDRANADSLRGRLKAAGFKEVTGERPPGAPALSHGRDELWQGDEAKLRARKAARVDHATSRPKPKGDDERPAPTGTLYRVVPGDMDAASRARLVETLKRKGWSAVSGKWPKAAPNKQHARDELFSGDASEVKSRVSGGTK
jgi:hypothetical protein